MVFRLTFPFAVLGPVFWAMDVELAFLGTLLTEIGGAFAYPTEAFGPMAVWGSVGMGHAGGRFQRRFGHGGGVVLAVRVRF